MRGSIAGMTETMRVYKGGLSGLILMRSCVILCGVILLVSFVRTEMWIMRSRQSVNVFAFVKTVCGMM